MVTVHMTNITNQFWINNFRYKFQFESGGGNNIYIDNINIYSGAPSDTLVVGLQEVENDVRVEIYPNPAESEIQVDFSTNMSANAEVIVKDLTGKKLNVYPIFANAGFASFISPIITMIIINVIIITNYSLNTISNNLIIIIA